MNDFNQPFAELLAALKSSPEGLTDPEARRRLEQFGANKLQEKKKIPAWRLFLRQFKDFMILILIAAAVLSGAMGDVTDTVIILIIIVLNAVIGFIQEYRAEQAIDALRKMTVTATQVVRENKARMISSTELVPGDVVLLEAGNVVPADIRLFEARSFRVDESSLTGESVAVDKTDEEIAEESAALGDRLNMSFKGTLVTNGRARGLVVATGMNTELGKIAGMLQEEQPPTPLQQRMTAFGKNLSYIILLICLVLFIAGVWRGEAPFGILLISISLAVAAIPEALPALITVALARGAARLAKQNALVRKLPAVETLGSVTFICTDKTGTLTQNKMRVVEIYEHRAADTESGISPLKLGMALNHDVKFDDAHAPFGESTELALVEKVIGDASFDEYRKIIRRYPRVAELPFDSDRKCMTTVHHGGDGGFLVLTKGAGEAVAAALGDPEEAEKLKTLSDEWAAKGIRVLAFAARTLDALPEPFNYETVEQNLEFAGLTGLADPPRAEVKAAISECRRAGIKPVMITGDHPATARAVAAEIGILDDKGLVLTGTELRALADEDFVAQVERTVVYARVSPDQKLKIVRALQAKGHFAAMTGDGVNDAPSLRAANIGIAMGLSGTDVSKEAAHLILLDDNFATIVKAVREGRRIFDNIRKFVKYIMTGNSAEILTISVPLLAGLPIPLLPIQILWINLVTDGLPALALAGEPAEADVMRRRPRAAGESLFSDGVGYHIIRIGLLMAAVTLGTQLWATYSGVAHWQTMVFTVLSLSQLGHVLAIRSDRTFLYRHGIFTNLPLLGAVLLTFALQLAVIYMPFMNDIFKTQPLTAREFFICLALSAIVFHAVELEKWLKMRFSKR